ncbi:ethanolamine permease [Hufsiella ginkgonis]|uniref:Ethanolamine permease n=1 Tax=Hufsiella ginkgonis TaxID=2695274 RepID=A0A7K1XYP8_9SPHI|nr:ethanolamine permease [Hufsiella ginkgonis]MXV16121.1 ethanolamine permease [Hufsiella ginkgonis]
MSQPLKRALTAIHLWAIAVGLVISGEYFGWNYGWDAAGTVGFLIATLLITVMYVTFIFSFTELTSAIPHAGGPFAYSYRACGPLGGFIAGYATLVEFVFAPPAIALALGSYVHFLHPAAPVLAVAFGCYVLFIVINLLGVKESAMFSLAVTVLAVAELLLFMGIVAPAYEHTNFMANPMPHGWPGVFEALPFAIWFYLAIEGVAMVAEEVRDPARNIPRGYLWGMFTLVVLAMGVMVLTGGITDWRRLSRIDYPLPEAIGIVLGKTSSLTRLFAGIGLFGLIASFHSIILSYSREIYALARSGYLPRFLSQVHPKTRVPHWALIAGGLVGCISLLTNTTGQVIILSAMGAVVMYITSMISLFVIRKKEPGLHRPFIAPFYPLFPAIALVLSVISLAAITWFNPRLALLFVAGMVLMGGICFLVPGSGKTLNGAHVPGTGSNP